MDKEFCEKIEKRLNKGILSGRLLLSKMRMIDEASRLSPPYTDPKYIPFYHYLAQEITPVNVIEIGFRLGLCSGTFLNSCKSVKRFLALQEETKIFYSPRIAKHNIRDHFKGQLDVHVGSVTDDQFLAMVQGAKWDLAFINEEKSYDSHISYLEILWDNMSLDGTILVEYVNYHDYVKKAYFDFCKRNNREPCIFKTRYGVGVITK